MTIACTRAAPQTTVSRRTFLMALRPNIQVKEAVAAAAAAAETDGCVTEAPPVAAKNAQSTQIRARAFEVRISSLPSDSRRRGVLASPAAKPRKSVGTPPLIVLCGTFNSPCNRFHCWDHTVVSTVPHAPAPCLLDVSSPPTGAVKSAMKARKTGPWRRLPLGWLSLITMSWPSLVYAGTLCACSVKLMLPLPPPAMSPQSSAVKAVAPGSPDTVVSPKPKGRTPARAGRTPKRAAATSPKGPSPKAASPKGTSPRGASPKAASPQKAASPRVSPKGASPRAGSPKGEKSPRAASPRKDAAVRAQAATRTWLAGTSHLVRASQWSSC